MVLLRLANISSGRHVKNRLRTITPIHIAHHTLQLSIHSTNVHCFPSLSPVFNPPPSAIAIKLRTRALSNIKLNLMKRLSGSALPFQTIQEQKICSINSSSYLLKVQHFFLCWARCSNYTIRNFASFNNLPPSSISGVGVGGEGWAKTNLYKI